MFRGDPLRRGRGEEPAEVDDPLDARPLRLAGEVLRGDRLALGECAVGVARRVWRLHGVDQVIGD